VAPKRKWKPIEAKRFVGERIGLARKLQTRRQLRVDVETGDQTEETVPFTQEALGLLLKRYLGQTWSGRQVSDAERGVRALDATELFAFAAVLKVPPEWFLSLDRTRAELKGGTT
jgi:transcriptional regulator with XRE-family HTH domain